MVLYMLDCCLRSEMRSFSYVFSPKLRWHLYTLISYYTSIAGVYWNIRFCSSLIVRYIDVWGFALIDESTA